MKIHYVYFKHRVVSFNIVAKKYIEQLKAHGFDVVEHDSNLSLLLRQYDKFDVVILHPALHIALQNPAPAYTKLIKRSRHAIAIDVCDTDHITPLAAWILSMHDHVFTSCKWCREVYVKSGCQTPVHVLPHGVDEYFVCREPREPRDPDIKHIAELNCFKVLYFLWHDSFRKAVDVVADAMAKIMSKYGNRVCFIVKLSDVIDPLFNLLSYIPNTIFIRKWFSIDDLIDFYDIVDLVIVPSRSGGFELNALEALARRKPVIVSEWPAFNDYCDRCLKCRSRGTVKIYDHSPTISLIHDGKGVDPDPNDLARLIEYVIENYDDVTKRYETIWDRVRNEFTWGKVTKPLIDVLKSFG